MASELASSAISKTKQVIMGSGGNKQAQLADHMVTADQSSRLTTDYGVRQNNTDEWLRVTTDQQTGPMLLEDPFGREKVSCTCELFG